jgi:choline dehydrogenase-like flavoprotein
MSRHYDVIIIGTGAGGGTLAYHLAPSGKNILLLERGDYVPREKENWDTRAVNLEGRYNTKELWRDKDGKELHPHTNYYVGGNTKFYGAALFRLRQQDFGELKHHGGISPAWPIAYEELEPYYQKAEELYQVHGTRGEDPTEPPCSGPFPHPAVSHEPRIQQLSEDFALSGLKPFHTPLGVMLNERNPRKSRCIRCGTCDGHPCLISAKADAQVVCVDPASEYPNVTLLTNSKVERLETSASGKEISNVVVTREGLIEEFTADIVVVSCGAINSAALLLRSANDKHPNGLANGSDVVGRHYMGHINSVLMAISKCPNPTVFQKSLSVNDFYFGSPDWQYPMGHISFVGKLDAATLSAGAPAIAPGFTLDLMAKHSLDFWLTSEDLPDPNNRVTLNRDGEIVLSYTPNNAQSHDRLKAALQRAMKQTNCSIHGHECHQGLFARNLYLGQKIPLAGVAHQNGTIRFGNDSTSSALDRNCKAHEIDNLYVVDASFFPSSGAVNPALTIMANALRVGDHLKRRLGVRDSSAKRTTEAVPEVVVVTSGVRRLLRETLIDPQKPGMLSGNSRLISESEIDVPLSSITPPISNDGSNA